MYGARLLQALEMLRDLRVITIRKEYLPDRKAAVKVKNLTKSFGKEKVLKGISHTF